MADPLADVLNRIGADPQSAGPVAPPRRSTFWDTMGKYISGAGDYVMNTDPRAAGEALLRVMPISSSMMASQDLATGKTTENARLMASGVAQIPTDIASGTLGLYNLLSKGTEAIGIGALPGAEGAGEAADAVSQFGTDIGSAIAGRPVNNDMLRGTGPQMAANWTRTLAGAIIPLPSKVADPLVKMATFNTGVKAVDTSAAIAGKTLEALTPFAISSKPSGGVVAANMAGSAAVSGGLEALINGNIPQRPVDIQQQQADALAAKGLQDAFASIDGAKKPILVQAGIPSTGDDLADAVILGTAAVGAVAGLRRDLAKRVADGLVKATTGYDANLPIDKSQQSFATKFKQQHLNLPEGATRSLEQMLGPDAADKFAEQTAQRRGVGVSTREQKFLRDGEFMDSKVKTVPLNDFVVQHESLSPDQKTLFSNRQWARQELDDRARMITKMKNGFNIGPPGSTQADTLLGRASGSNQFPINSYAHNLYDMTNKDLLNVVRMADSDPAIANLTKMYRNILDNAPTYMAEQRRFTQQEVNKFKQNNPNYVPVQSERGSFLDPRALDVNLDKQKNVTIPRGLRTFEELGSAAHVLPKYMDEVFRSTEGAKIKRDYMLAALRQKDAGNAYAGQIIGRDTKLSNDADARHITWRDQYGNKRFTEINDAVVRNSLDGMSDPTALQLQHGIMSTLVRGYESGAVGPLSLINGTVFAPKSAIYTSTIGTALSRPKGVAMGWFDKLFQEGQRAAGIANPIAFKGDVIGMLGDSTVRAGQNIGAVLAERGATAMHNSVLTNGMLTKMFDPKSLEATATALSNWYKKSDLYRMQEHGLMGPSGFGAVDRTKMYTNPGQQFKQSGVLKTPYSFVNDILHAISSAPGMSVMALNKDLMKTDPTKVTSAIRNMAGDPGRSGAFRGGVGKAEAALIKNTPWGNVYVQSMSRLAESLSSPKTAASTAIGIANAAIVPAVMASLWNQHQGPEYTKYQYMERPSDKLASSIYIALPGRPPNEGLEIDLDPLLRPFKSVAEGLLGVHLGAFSGELFKPENSDLRDAYSEAVTHRYGFSPFKENTVASSIMQQVILPPVPPAAQAIGAMTGNTIRGYGDVRAQRPNTSAGFIEGTGPDPAKQQFMGHTIPAQVEDVIRSIGASGAAAIYNIVLGMNKDMTGTPTVAPKSFGEAAAYQGKEYTQKLGDSTKELGSSLFGNFTAITPSTEASAAVVKEKMNTLKAMSDAFKATHQSGAENTTFIGNKKRGFEPRLGAGPAGAPDFETEALSADMANIYKQMAPVLGEIKDAYQQRQSIQSDNSVSPTMKRALMEEQSYRVIDINRRALQDLQRFEAVMSQQYGRPISFTNFNKNKPAGAQ